MFEMLPNSVPDTYQEPSISPSCQSAQNLRGVDFGEPIVKVCQGGARSLSACSKVEANNSHLWNLIGGTNTQPMLFSFYGHLFVTCVDSGRTMWFSQLQ